MITTSNVLETPFSLEVGFFKILRHIDLKKLIFTYLNLDDQREVYWSNKAKLRPLLSNSALDINIKSLKVRSSLDMGEERVYNLLELPDRIIACWLKEVIILKRYNNNIFEEIRRIPYNILNCKNVRDIEDAILTYDKKHVINSVNTNSVNTTLDVWDLNFNYIESITVIEDDSQLIIYNLSNLSSSSFIIAIHDDHFSCLKAYQFNNDKNQYELFLLVEEWNSFLINCCLYSQKNDYLICGTRCGKIKVSMEFSTISPKKFSDLFTEDISENNQNHFNIDYVGYLISLDDDLFASTSYTEIYIWNYQNSHFNCIGTISPPADYHDNLWKQTRLIIQRLGDNFIVGAFMDNPDILIFNFKTFECVKVIAGKNDLGSVIVTQDNSIFSANFYEESIRTKEDCTKKPLLQIWKIFE